MWGAGAGHRREGGGGRRSTAGGEDKLPLPPPGRLYAPPGGVKVPPHEYMGSPPSGRSTLTPPGSAGELPAMRWEGQECVSASTLTFLPRSGTKKDRWPWCILFVA